MRILLAYFSWTGSTRTVAEEIRRQLSGRNQVDVCEITPVKGRGYIGWLLRSLLPGYRVGVRVATPDLSQYDLLLLGSPKWGLGCPPVNEYIRRLRGVEGCRFAVFLTYGGFDGRRYLDGLVKALLKKGLVRSGWLLVKRRSVLEGRCEGGVEEFCKRLGSG